MSVQIPEAYKDLLNATLFPTLVTLMPDGGPQASFVWFNYDGQHLFINTTQNRQKARNMQARPRVTLLFGDPKNPYRYLEVRGKVVSYTEEGAIDHINQLRLRYEGIDDFYSDKPERRGEARLIFKIEPLHFTTH